MAWQPSPYSSAPPPAPTFAPADRVRTAWQRRPESDYVCDFWTALGWTVLSFGIYGFYVLYQLVRRSRDHNLRRLELLDAATQYAWDKANARGLAEELRPNFERVGASLAVLRAQTGDFRDPVIWTVLAVFASGVVHFICYWLLDADLVKHDRAEGAAEAELAAIFHRLGATVESPDPSRLKGPHNYWGRVAATVFTCGLYALWWLADVMREGNAHFEHNWRFEDSLASAVQQLGA